MLLQESDLKPSIPVFKFHKPDFDREQRGANKPEIPSSLNQLEEFTAKTLPLSATVPIQTPLTGPASTRIANGHSTRYKWKKDSRHSSQSFNGLFRSSDSRNRGVINGGVQKPMAHRTIYEKIYGASKSNKRELITSTAINRFSCSAVQTVCNDKFFSYLYHNMIPNFTL